MLKSLRWAMGLLGTIGVVAALAVAGPGYYFISKLDTTANNVSVVKDLVADILPPPLYLIEMRLVLSMMLDGSLYAQDGQKRFEELARDYSDRVDYWNKNPPFGMEAKLLGLQHSTALAFMAAARVQLVEPLAAGKVDVAKANLPAVHALYLQHRAGVDVTVVDGNAFAQASTKEFEHIQSITGWAMSLTALLAAAAVFVVYRMVLASIQKPVRASTQAAKLIASGDLVTQVPLDMGRTDSLGALQEALQTMRSGLNVTVTSVREVAGTVANASAEIAQGNNDLSARTESQASALEQTASMEELTSMVTQNAEAANKADLLAKQAAEVAQLGGAAVAEVVETMRGINESSRQIAGIVSVIDGIAFQTNILALNAAVEAARAGEQGRGFAVVASEVRSLASRSAAAAKEIKTLIDVSVERMVHGSALADNAGSTMRDMLDATQRVSNILGEISSASQEQSSGIAQVGEAVSQMDQVTQQNAALVEEIAATASTLRGQASELVRQMAQFTVQDDRKALGR